MALAITVPGNASDMTGVPGNNKYVIKTATFDSSYATGGEALTAATLGLESIHIVLLSMENSGYVAQYDYTNSKIALYEAGADGAILDEVANTTDVSAVAVRVLVFGR
tara:strand:+ start:7290 stop:7613 length:324 start_codon:yes stop_codon:yes gene_type:complete